MLEALTKSILRNIAILLVSPLIISHRLLSLLRSPNLSLESHSQLLSLLPGQTGNFLRVAFYRYTLDHCDPTATICFGVLFSKTDATIEQNVYIGPRCMIGMATIKKDSLIGPHVQIPSGPHTHGINRCDTPIRKQMGTLRRVTIGEDCWIGAGAIILNDVESKCVVGANSVVTKKTKSMTVVAGNPCKLLSNREKPENE